MKRTKRLIRVCLLVVFITTAGKFYQADYIENRGFVTPKTVIDFTVPGFTPQINSPTDLIRKIRDKNIIALNHDCIGNFYDFAYRQRSIDFGETKNEHILPGNPWNEVINFESNNISLAEYSLLGVSSFEGRTLLWIDWHTTPGVNLEEQYFILFDPETKQTIQIQKEINNSAAFANELYFFPDGSVWASVFIKSNKSEMSISRLVQFDTSTMRFQEVEGFLSIPDTKSTLTLNIIQTVLQTPDGKIWLFVGDDGLYVYDQRSNEVQKKLEIDGSIIAAYPDYDGKIYFLPELNWNSPRMIKVLRFSPVVDKLETYMYVPKDMIIQWDILKDDNGYLWFGSQTIVDQEKKLYNLHPNLINWLQNMYTTRSEYYLLPKLLFQDKKGYMWFESGRILNGGTAWFDPESGESCWFTTYTGGTFESPDGTIWTLANDRLYKFNAKE